MIQAKFKQEGSNIFIHINGHTDPLICSAASAITYTMLGTLINYKVDGWDMNYWDRDGDMYCEIFGIKDENSDRLKVVLESWYIGLNQIMLLHPDKINIITEE